MGMTTPRRADTIEYLSDRPEFIPVVNRWCYDEWGWLVPGRTEAQRLAILETTMLGKGSIPCSFVAVLEEATPAGTAAIVAHDLETQPHRSPWLASLYVPEKYRHRGIGSRLVRHAVTEAANLGVETLYLYTWDHRTLYEALGWRAIEMRKYNGQSIWIMDIRP